MKAGSGAGNRALAAALSALALMAAGGVTDADASPGGLRANPMPTPEAPVQTGATTSALIGGRAISPAEAPAVVKQVVAAANRIRTTPYIWGGGHRSWVSRGYDCSGSVSYALHGGGLLESPLVSGSFASWGAPGPGRWITIYANSTHVYAVIAGLRWDTVGDSSGTGPRWHESPPYPKGFTVRHPIGY
jgi:cell wall-associated NlpC family hydrolase